MALRREIESLSPVRQTGRLTRCVTEQARRIGASGPSRTATECALNALPLPVGVQTRLEPRRDTVSPPTVYGACCCGKLGVCFWHACLPKPLPVIRFSFLFQFCDKLDSTR